MEYLISQLGYKLATSTLFFIFLLLSLDIKNIEDLDEWKKRKLQKRFITKGKEVQIAVILECTSCEGVNSISRYIPEKIWRMSEADSSISLSNSYSLAVTTRISNAHGHYPFSESILQFTFPTPSPRVQTLSHH